MEVKKIQNSSNLEKRLEAIEEKVDKILSYQKQSRIMSISRLSLQILTIAAIVILPILGFYYVADLITESVGLTFSEVGDILKNMKDFFEIGVVDSIKGIF